VRADADGRIHLDYEHNNLEGHERLVKTLGSPGASSTTPTRSRSTTSSSIRCCRSTAPPTSCGTVRFGADPKSSVLDPWCKAHELDNLYVVDTSFFVTSASVNPTLTTVANAMRVGDHLIERLGAMSRFRRTDPGSPSPLCSTAQERS
jgi:choline dehydrogenase-like flavoprotein